MARFQRRYGIDTSAAGPDISNAYRRLASSLEQFSNLGNRFGAQMSAAEAQRDAGEVEPSTQAPELRSPATVYGRQYNEVVLKGHLAATQNAMKAHIDKLALDNPDNPQGFTQGVNGIREAYLSNVAPEARAAAAISFDAFANNQLLDIQARQAKDAREASILAQTEALANTRNTALEALRKRDEQAFVDMTAVYQEALENSSLQMTEKAKAIISYKREANLMASVADMDELLKAGQYGNATKLIQDVRDGKMPMVFGDTGLTPEMAADYMQERMLSYVSDYETELKARNAQEDLREAKLEPIRRNVVKEGYDLQAKGELTLEWARANRGILDEQDYKYFIESAASGGGLDVDADPGAYADLIGRAVSARTGAEMAAVQDEAERLLRAGLIEKTWFDQINEQITDTRFDAADDYIEQATRVEGEFNPVAQAKRARTMLNWGQWKQNNPDASQQDAIKEAMAQVSDADMLQGRLDILALPRPRHAVMLDGNVDVGATLQALTNATMERLNIGADVPRETIGERLMNDPDFRQQYNLIQEWKRVQSQ